MSEKRVLKEGEIIIFPTDTVFGMGCRLYDDKAINRIFDLKDRVVDKHIPILCSSLLMASSIGVIEGAALKLAKKYWPGPLTLIVESSQEHYLKSNNLTVGLRVPNHKIALELIGINGPLATTSVNKSGLEPLTNIADIIKYFQADINYIYGEDNKSYLNVSSTVVDLTTEEVKFLRIGSISKEEIIKTLKEE